MSIIDLNPYLLLNIEFKNLVQAPLVLDLPDIPPDIIGIKKAEHISVIVQNEIALKQERNEEKFIVLRAKLLDFIHLKLRELDDTILIEDTRVHCKSEQVNLLTGFLQSLDPFLNFFSSSLP